LHVTGSAISKSVSRLEARLGSTLLERTTRRLKLTDAGHAYYQTCIRIMEELAEAESVLAAQRSIPSGRLRLAVPNTYGRLCVMPLLITFCQQHPEIDISMTFSDRFVDLFDEGIDVAVRIGKTAEMPASLGYRQLGREKMVFCASPAYLAREGRPESVGRCCSIGLFCTSASMAAVSRGSLSPRMGIRTGVPCPTIWRWGMWMPSYRQCVAG
jgi:DNA-binding transcriptional LysR family regulator